MKIYVAYVKGINKYPWEGSIANKGRIFYETFEEAISCTADLIILLMNNSVQSLF